MVQSYLSSAFFQAQAGQLYAVFGWSQRQKLPILSQAWVQVLEIFTHEYSPEQAYALYQQHRQQPAPASLLAFLNQEQLVPGTAAVVGLTRHRLTLYQQGWKGIVDQAAALDLTPWSRETSQVLLTLFAQQHLEDDRQKFDNFATFEQLVEQLNALGLLSPAVGRLDWGDLQRHFPLCHACGFTRGTPIDRYYLSKFVAAIQDQVVGDVLEIGGVPKDRDFYDFSDRPSYRVLNLEPGAGVDIVGDVHQAHLIEPESLDSIVIFNVLEHCYAPWEVVNNLHRWLKVGGKCFCLVPSAQRLHDRPADYWRLLPDGMTLLFKNFAQQQLYVYGNPLAVVAIFHGLVVEDLTAADLDAFHPDYPVVTCVVATK